MASHHQIYRPDERLDRVSRQTITFATVVFSKDDPNYAAFERVFARFVSANRDRLRASGGMQWSSTEYLGMITCGVEVLHWSANWWEELKAIGRVENQPDGNVLVWIEALPDPDQIIHLRPEPRWGWDGG